MAEAIMVSIFFLILVYLQGKEQMKIEMAAKNSKLRKLTASILSAALLLIFWPSNLPNQVKLVAFALLILVFGFSKEGLKAKGLVKLGLLEGDLQIFEKIQLEELPNQQVYVTFHKTKTNHYSLTFESSLANLTAFFNQNGFNGKLVIDELTETDEVKSLSLK